MIKTEFARILLVIALIVTVASCRPYKTIPKDTIQVLAVTSKGDTILLDINTLRPRVYTNIYYNYPYGRYYRPYPYNFYGNSVYINQKPRPQYNNNNNQSNNRPSGSGPNVSSPVLTKPPSNPPNKKTIN